jgi:hypothetical protein
MRCNILLTMDFLWFFLKIQPILDRNVAFNSGRDRRPGAPHRSARSDLDGHALVTNTNVYLVSTNRPV